MADNNSNKAGDTKTTSEEYIKRESGEQSAHAVPAENPGHASPSCDDLEHPEHRSDKSHPKDKKIAEQIKKTNAE